MSHLAGVGVGDLKVTQSPNEPPTLVEVGVHPWGQDQVREIRHVHGLIRRRVTDVLSRKKERWMQEQLPQPPPPSAQRAAALRAAGPGIAAQALARPLHQPVAGPQL